VLVVVAGVAGLSLVAAAGVGAVTPGYGGSWSSGPFDAVEGSAFSGVLQTYAPCSDPSSVSATITWGDGQSSPAQFTRSAQGANVCDVSGSHVYAEESDYDAYVTYPSSSGSDTRGPQMMHVADEPVALAGSTITVARSVAGTIATFSDPDGIEADAQYSATVDWGDGTTSPATISANAIDASHAYALVGTYAVKTWFTSAGGFQSVTSTVTVTGDSGSATAGQSYSGKPGVGCPAKVVTPAPSSDPASKAVLVPAGAVGVLLCRYRGLNSIPRRPGTLANSRLLRAHKIVAQLSRRFDALPAPSPGAVACPSDDNSKLIAFFRYGHSHNDPITVQLTGCRLVSDGHLLRSMAGDQTGRLEQQLLALTGCVRPKQPADICRD
jgi:hypothetical protein